MKGIAKLAAAGCVMGLVVSDCALGQSMTSNEAKATSISKKWRGTRGMVTIGPDGKVIFLYGETQPSVVCSPLQVCDIELQGGEIVRDKQTREAFPAEMQFGIGIQNRAFENGLVCRSLGTAIAFAPPLISTPEQIDAVVSRFRDALDRSLDAYLAGGGRLGD